MTTEAANM